MDNRQFRTIHMFRRVLECLDHHGIEPEPPLLIRQRQALTKTMGALSELGATQDLATRQARTGSAVQHLRQKLRRERLIPLSRIAKPLLKFAPGTQVVMRVPHARTDTLTLAQHGEKVAQVLSRHTRLLASAGFSKDFLVDLRTESRELAAMAQAHSKSMQRLSRATVEVKRHIKKGMDTVMVADGIILAHTRDASLLAAWRNARRIERKTGRPTDRVLANRKKRAEAEAAIASVTGASIS